MKEIILKETDMMETTPKETEMKTLLKETDMKETTPEGD